MAKTNGIAGGNPMLQNLLTRTRLENSVSYNGAKVKLATDKTADKIEDQNKADEEQIAKIDDNLANSEKESTENATPEEKVKIEGAKKESEESNADDITKPATDSDVNDVEAKFAKDAAARDKKEEKAKAEEEKNKKIDSAASPEEKAKKIEAIDDILEPQKDKLDQLKSAAAEIKDPKKKEQVKDNVKDLTTAIDDLKKRKETLGESYVSFENEIWSINILLEKLSSRIDDYLINQ
jgi:hypothetical protein